MTRCLGLRNSLQLVLLLSLVFTPGCTGDDFTVGGKSVSREKRITKAATKSSVVSPKSKANTQNEPELTSGSYALLNQWRIPLTSDEQFFSAQNVNKISTEPSTTQRDVGVVKENYRLLGFVKVDSGQSAEFQAILRIEGRLTYCKIGDLVEEVEVVDINPPSVTLQCRRQRWDIQLHEQPTVHQGVKYASTRTNPPSQRRSGSTSGHAKNPNSSSPDVLFPQTSQPRTSLPQQVVAPEIAGEFDLPNIPELPDIPDIPFDDEEIH